MRGNNTRFGNKRLPKEAREQIAVLKKEGWEFLGCATGGHLKLRHESGAKATIAKTPSDKRTRKNEIAMARRRVRNRARA